LRFFFISILALGFIAGRTSRAAEPEHMYYLGEAKLSSGDGKPYGSQILLLEKIHDSDKHLIVERAVVVKPDGTFEQYTMNMVVTGDTFTITDMAHTISGTGTLFGPPWHWTYFRATFKSTNGVTIEDENFLSDPSVGTARKKIIAPDGKVIQYMDVVLKAVTPATFEILSAALLKK
jgi:hypothetical protein